MYGIEVVTPPAAGPVAAAELRAWLRLYDPAEDDTLSGLLSGAVDLFEHDAGRPVLATTYRQYLSRWPGDALAAARLGGLPPAGWPGWVTGRLPGAPVVLGRGGVTAVGGVYRVLADGSAAAVDPATWHADLHTPPPRVYLDSTPAVVTTAGGAPVTPAGYVEFTAGWATAAAVPPLVRTALMLLAGHWYENREAFTDGALDELPSGWCRVVARFKTGVSGDWGQ